MRSALPNGAPANIRDIGASFAARYGRAAIETIDVPVRILVGVRGPAIMHTVVRSVGTLMPRAIITMTGAYRLQQRRASKCRGR
jgi:hypothetical protein